MESHRAPMALPALIANRYWQARTPIVNASSTAIAQSAEQRTNLHQSTAQLRKRLCSPSSQRLASRFGCEIGII